MKAIGSQAENDLRTWYC